MIILNWRDDNEGKGFTKEEPVYLYVIGEIYKNHSSYDNPLRDIDVVKYMETEYQLPGIDPHVIKRYRSLLNRFGFCFEPDIDTLKENKTINRKGYFLSSVDDTLDDFTLVNLSLLIKCNKSIDVATKGTLLSDIQELAAYTRAKELIDTVLNMDLVDEKEVPEREEISRKIVWILTAIKNKTAIGFFHDDGLDRKVFRPIYTSFYPRCAFVKNDDYHVLGIRYVKKGKMLRSYSEIYKLKNMKKIGTVKNKAIDEYQNDLGTITSYGLSHQGNVASVAQIKDIINGLGDIEEGHVFHNDLKMEIAEFEAQDLTRHDLRKILSRLKGRYGSNVEYVIEGNAKELERKQRNPLEDASERYSATLKLRASRDEVFSVAFKYSNQLKLKAPKNLVWAFNHKVKSIYQSINEDKQGPLQNQMDVSA